MPRNLSVAYKNVLRLYWLLTRCLSRLLANLLWHIGRQFITPLQDIFETLEEPNVRGKCKMWDHDLFHSSYGFIIGCRRRPGGVGLWKGRTWLETSYNYYWPSDFSWPSPIFRHFIRRFALVSAPDKIGPWGKWYEIWIMDCESVFEKLRTLISSSPIMQSTYRYRSDDTLTRLPLQSMELSQNSIQTYRNAPWRVF